MRRVNLAVLKWILASSAMIGFVTALASAQVGNQAALENNIELLRANVRYEKTNWIRSNLPLTEREAEIFWPLYRRYQLELDKIGKERLALIEDFARHHETLTDSKARAILDQSFAIESKLSTIRRLYKGEFLTVLSPRVVARFFQVEHRLNLLIDIESASLIPLIE
jgi:hypothetical protein